MRKEDRAKGQKDTCKTQQVLDCSIHQTGGRHKEVKQGQGESTQEEESEEWQGPHRRSSNRQKGKGEKGLDSSEGCNEKTKKGRRGGTRRRQEGRGKEEIQKKGRAKEGKEAKKNGCATGQTQGSNAWGCEWLQAPGFEGAGCLRQGVDNSLRQGRSVAVQETLH